MINKEKLLAELSNPKHFGYDLIEVIKNFPEEPGIDFDALWKDYKNYCIKHDVKCGSCSLNTRYNGGETCFTNFLKSKNLTAQKPVEIPVKKTWTLKKDVEEIFHDFGNTPYPVTSDPPENLKKYYDLKDEPDYSKIPKGSIVEFIYNHQKKLGYIERVSEDGIYVNCVKIQSSDIIRIVELAKEKVC